MSISEGRMGITINFQEWLEQVKSELHSIDTSLLQKDTGIPLDSSRDTVVGVASEFIAKLYLVARRTDKQADEEALKLKYDTVGFTPQQTEQKLNEIMERKSYASLLREMMWYYIRCEHNLFATNSIGIRNGFVIVSTKGDE